ncbi:MAG: DNA polymerase III subunit beta [Ruminococcaceae bacterium]|nr:DNA polymerase III subunit beta [Oscillospiraceae bacterium]
MIIHCEKQSLYEMVSNASRAVSGKMATPALEGILLSADKKELGGNIKISGYNLEIGITAEAACNVAESGDIVINAKLFSDILRNMPSGTITLSTNDKNIVEIKCGSTEYSILGMSARDYPQLPGDSDTESEIILNSGTLKGMISQTLFAVATIDTRPALTGVKFIFSNGLLTMVSLDGYRLAVRKENVEYKGESTFIVPGRALSEISRMISGEDDDITLRVTKRHIIFEIKEYNVITRLLEGEFLDHNKAIPSGGTTTVEVETRNMIESVERTSPIIDDRLRSHIKVDFSDGYITSACTTTIGRAFDKIECKLEGNNVSVGFSNHYLLDALKAADCDKVKIVINGPLSPVKILPPEGESFLFLVVPVKLKG